MIKMKITNFLFVVGCTVVSGSQASRELLGVMNDKISFRVPSSFKSSSSSFKSSSSSFVENGSSIEEDKGISEIDEDEIENDESEFFVYGSKESIWNDLIVELSDKPLIKKSRKIIDEVEKYIRMYKNIQKKLKVFIEKTKNIIETKGNNIKIIRGLKILIRFLGIKALEWTISKKFLKKGIIKAILGLIKESKKVMDKKEKKYEILVEEDRIKIAKLEEENGGEIIPNNFRGEFQEVLDRNNINLIKQNNTHKKILEYGKEQLLTLTRIEYKILKFVGIKNMNKIRQFNDIESTSQISLYIHQLQQVFLRIVLRYLKAGILPLPYSDFKVKDIEELKEFNKKYRQKKQEEFAEEVKEYKEYDNKFRDEYEKQKNDEEQNQENQENNDEMNEGGDGINVSSSEGGGNDINVSSSEGGGDGINISSSEGGGDGINISSSEQGGDDINVSSSEEIDDGINNDVSFIQKQDHLSIYSHNPNNSIYTNHNTTNNNHLSFIQLFKRKNKKTIKKYGSLSLNYIKAIMNINKNDFVELKRCPPPTMLKKHKNALMKLLHKFYQIYREFYQFLFDKTHFPRTNPMSNFYHDAENFFTNCN